MTPTLSLLIVTFVTLIGVTEGSCLKFLEVFNGECTNGKEIRMYEGKSSTTWPRMPGAAGGDNPGTTDAERTEQCGIACRDKKTALSGTWSGFNAVGFIVVPDTGRCYCENVASSTSTCGRYTDIPWYYRRYDFATCMCGSSVGVGDSIQQRGIAFGSSSLGGAADRCTADGPGVGVIGTGQHCYSSINDGKYGNSFSWIPNFLDAGVVNGIAGVTFDKVMKISGFGISRDNGNPLWTTKTTGFQDVANLGNVGGTLEACKIRCVSPKWAATCRGISVRNSDKSCWLEGVAREGDLPGPAYTTYMRNFISDRADGNIIFEVYNGNPTQDQSILLGSSGWTNVGSTPAR